MSTPFLAAWLLLKLRHFEQARDENRCSSVTRTFRSLLDFGAGAAGLCDSMPSITVRGIELPVARDLTLPLGELLRVYPTLPHEWSSLLQSALTAGLSLWPDNNQPALVDVLASLEARSNYSELPQGHLGVAVSECLLVRSYLLRGACDLECCIERTAAG